MFSRVLFGRNFKDSKHWKKSLPSPPCALLPPTQRRSGPYSSPSFVQQVKLDILSASVALSLAPANYNTSWRWNWVFQSNWLTSGDSAFLQWILKTGANHGKFLIWQRWAVSFQIKAVLPLSSGSLIKKASPREWVWFHRFPSGRGAIY